MFGNENFQRISSDEKEKLSILPYKQHKMFKTLRKYTRQIVKPILLVTFAMAIVLHVL